ncbi:hypothetical protein M075_1996 [Bacteroides fragilis str. 20793-3]|nr:hypothetical protein M075_1996 [Bacteroides fragilis str. 20793-3]
MFFWLLLVYDFSEYMKMIYNWNYIYLLYCNRLRMSILWISYCLICFLFDLL